MRSYYKNVVPNQYRTVYSNLVAGLNEYSPALEINDNQLSDCLDVLPYRDEILEFSGSPSSVTKFFYNNAEAKGIIYSIIPAEESVDASSVWQFYALSRVPNVSWYILYINYNSITPDITSYTLASGNADSNTDSCIFKTEADKYYCFIINTSKKLHYIKESTKEYGYVDLPFYPNQMIVHANRIFISSGNKLWWCRAGDLFSWYGEDYKDDYIAAEQNMKNGNLTITTQPDTSRYITFTHVVQGAADTIGKVSISGTDALGNSQSETLSLVQLGRVVSNKQYKTITTITQSDWAISGENDKIKIGVGPIGAKYVQADSGYWTIEREPSIVGMCTINDNIYLFGEHNIYVFQGYSYDTFNLQQIIADIGMYSSYDNGTKPFAIIKNIIYFRFRDDIYAFDGASIPSIISRPTASNPNAGGINLSGSEWGIFSDEKYLYLYKSGTSPDKVYQYNHDMRTWWKSSGLNKTVLSVTNDISVCIVPSYTKKYIFTFVNVLNPTDYNWFFITYHSLTQNNVYPYIVTKAFNSTPSEEGTLTNILLQVQGKKDATADISIYYNNSIDSTAVFTLIKTFSSYKFTGDIEILKIYLPVSSIAREHHYTLKVTIKSSVNSVYLYNMERKFRLIGWSR